MRRSKPYIDDAPDPAAKFQPVVWVWTPTKDKRFEEIKIHAVEQLEGPCLYAVRKLSQCLGKKGEWEFEPMPSSRDKAFFSRCRFKTLEEAQAIIEKYCVE